MVLVVCDCARDVGEGRKASNYAASRLGLLLTSVPQNLEQWLPHTLWSNVCSTWGKVGSHHSYSDKGGPSSPGAHEGGGGGGWHKASVSDCLPLAAPIGLSPLHILTLCGPEHVLVVSTEPLDDLSCLTTPQGRLSRRRAVARAVDQVHPDAHSESMLGLPTPPLT